MGISEKVSQITGQVQETIKSSSISLLSLTIKILSSVVLAMTISFVVQEIAGSGTFTFVFTMLVAVAGFMRLMKNWSLSKVLIFDLFCVLTALLLQLYLKVAP